MTKQLSGLFFAGYGRLRNRDEPAEELFGGIAKMSKSDVVTLLRSQNCKVAQGKSHFGELIGLLIQFRDQAYQKLLRPQRKSVPRFRKGVVLNDYPRDFRIGL